MKFANIELLWLLLLNLPLSYLWYRQRKKPATLVLPSIAQLQAATVKPTLRHYLYRYAVVWRILAFSCLVIALARPQSIGKVQEVKTEVVDIMVTLDTSLSMGATDMQSGNRLEVAKAIISQFIDKRAADRLGLVSFAAYSQVRCPLTLDYDILKEALRSVNLVDKNDEEANGTAIGIALTSSISHLRHSDAKSRVVILLTDGDNNVTTIEPQTAAEVAKVVGVKIYTIGVGTTGNVLMPSLNVNDPPGTMAFQPSGFNEDALRQIALTTGGKYFRATNRDVLANIFNEIDSLERTAIAVHRYEQYHEQFMPWLVVSMIILGLELILRYTYVRALP